MEETKIIKWEEFPYTLSASKIDGNLSNAQTDTNSNDTDKTGDDKTEVNDTGLNTTINTSDSSVKID